MIQRLVDDSLVVIRQALERAANPVIAWSAGKDSQVMLHLVRQVRTDLPVLHLRGFEDETKHDFAEDEIGRMGLLMIEPKPFRRDVVAAGDHIEIIEDYRLRESAYLYYPIEPDPNHVPGPHSLCAIEKLNQPAGGKPLEVDCVFIGARSDDTDPVHCGLPLIADLVEADGVLFVYPLKNWTESDIWEASEALGIPQNHARYKRKDMSANADYFPLCVECLKPTDKESIICPKIGRPVYAIGKHLNLEQRREAWRDKFINLKREQ